MLEDATKVEKKRGSDLPYDLMINTPTRWTASWIIVDIPASVRMEVKMTPSASRKPQFTDVKFCELFNRHGVHGIPDPACNSECHGSSSSYDTPLAARILLLQHGL